MKLKITTSLLILFVLLTSSTTIMILSGDPVLPTTPYNYSNLGLPSYYSTGQTSIKGMDNSPANNPVTDNGATLGRVLFYDVNLSKNKSISCASCHKQSLSFSDTAQLSLGFNKGKTGRHSMTIINTRYYQRGHAFWDERAATIEEQALKPFQDTVEMGLTLPLLLQRVSEQPFYADLFKKAFGDNAITSDRIGKAIAQFERSIVSYSSKYDVGRAQVATPNVAFPNFTASENEGKQIFMTGTGQCFTCHTSEAFVNFNDGPENNGIDAATTTDLGAGGPNALNQKNLIGRFKTSTLRNIELTPPYMHDGRFKTLEEVVEHYNSGIKAHPNLSGELKGQNNQPIKLNLTASQKTSLVNFLKTLTDNSITTNPKWSDPFPTTTDAMDLMTPSSQFNLGANYPNPFVNATTIPFTLNFESRVTLKIFDTMGREIVVLKKGYMSEGNQSITLDNKSNLSQGNYLYQLIIENENGQFMQSKIMVVQ